MKKRDQSPGFDSPHIEDVIALAIAIMLFVGASGALTQSDGDLFAHLAFGRHVLAHGGLPSESLLGLAPVPLPVVAPAWGAAVILALLDRLGGLSLVAAATAVLAGLTHGMAAAYWRSRGMSTIGVAIASLVGLVLVAPHWHARPHAVTLTAALLLVLVLERGHRRALRWIPLLFAGWANLHGGWIFGVLLLATYTIGVALERTSGEPGVGPRAWQPLAATLGASTVATLLTPYGVALHRAVFRSLADPTIGRVIDEYAPPSLSNPSDLLFLLLLGIAAVALLRGPRRPPLRLVLVVGVTALFALRAGRNISLFGATAWTMLAAHWAPELNAWTARFASRADASPRDAFACRPQVSAWSAMALVLILVVGAIRGRSERAAQTDAAIDRRAFPVDAVQELRATNARSRLLTTWAWSGFVPYAWTDRRTFFDPLVFTSRTVDAFGTMLLARPGWREELDRQQIDLVMVEPDALLATALRRQADWQLRYLDATTVVFARRAVLVEVTP